MSNSAIQYKFTNDSVNAVIEVIKSFADIISIMPLEYIDSSYITVNLNPDNFPSLDYDSLRQIGFEYEIEERCHKFSPVDFSVFGGDNYSPVNVEFVLYDNQDLQYIA